MIVANSTETNINQIIANLNQYVEADDRGLISFYLGLEMSEMAKVSKKNKIKK